MINCSLVIAGNALDSIVSVLSFSLPIHYLLLVPFELSDYIILSRSKSACLSISLSLSRECTLKKPKSDEGAKIRNELCNSWKAVSILIGVRPSVLWPGIVMDSKRYERSTRSNTESPPAPPSPPMYSTSYSTSHDNHKSRVSSRRSPSPSIDHHRSSRSSRNSSPLQERRKRRRSGSRSSPVRSHRRSRSSDKDRDRDRDRSRKYSRRDRSRSRSRGRSRSRDKRRSRSRNRSRDRHRYRESRRHHTNRAPSYESDALDEHGEGAGTVMHQTATVLPPPNAFKNDGSFMEMFKKMQEQMQPAAQKPTTSSVLEEKPVVPPPLMVGKRRGGRILKTGMVAKPKTEQTVEQPKDAWSLYMAEVKKYREVCCQEEDNTRPLVK